MFRYTENLVIALLIALVVLGFVLIDRAIAAKPSGQTAVMTPMTTLQKASAKSMKMQQSSPSMHKMAPTLTPLYATSSGKNLISTGSNVRKASPQTIRRAPTMATAGTWHRNSAVGNISAHGLGQAQMATSTAPKTTAKTYKKTNGNSLIHSFGQNNYQQLSESLRRNGNAATSHNARVKRFGNSATLGNGNYQQLSDALSGANSAKTGNAASMRKFNNANVLGQGNFRRLSDALGSASGTATGNAANIRKFNNANVLGQGNFRRLSDALGAANESPSDLVPRSGEGNGSPRGHNVGLFDRMGDSIAETIRDRQDSIHDAMERIEEAGSGDGPITDGGFDEMGPADSGDGPITDGGFDEMGPADSDDGPISDGGDDGIVPADSADDPIVDGGDDEGGPALDPADDGGDADVPGDGAADDGADDGVFGGGDGSLDEVLDIIDLLGHGVPFHGHRWNHWAPQVHVVAPVQMYEGVVIPANPLPVAQPPALVKTIVLLNPKETKQPVNFLLDGQQKSLEAEQLLELSAAQAMVIRFDRGGGFGIAEYSLVEGIYEFRLTDKGWDIVRRTFAVTVDNSQNAAEFNYFADGELVRLPGGETRRHEGRFPIAVEFDRGDGKAVEMMLPNGTYRIGLNAETQLLDLQPIPEAGEM